MSRASRRLAARGEANCAAGGEGEETYALGRFFDVGEKNLGHFGVERNCTAGHSTGRLFCEWMLSEVEVDVGEWFLFCGSFWLGHGCGVRMIIA